MSQAIRIGFRVFFILGLFLNVNISFSQDKEVEDVIKEASELFVKQEYSEAKDLYSQLVSLYPKDPNFNYRFGACLIAVDEDKTYPLKFLEYAVSRPNVDIDAFYFLGKGYHYNYRFEEAIQYFNKYKSKLDVKSNAIYPVEQDIRYCENGKLLLRDISTPLVIKKSKVSIADFFTSFKISDMGGRMMYAPKELHTATDKKKGYTPVMYKNSNSNFVYYSSYGPNDKNGLDLYKVHVSDAGVIGKPFRLPDNINTPHDERFPFLTEDESKFYFSSTGHNSMGGADIFVASHDSITQVFGSPVNLDYSINTPDDDFMYAELGGNSGIAFFASNRNSEKGQAFVYKINAKRKAFEIAVLAGFFTAENTKSCQITVEDLEEHVVVATFNTNKKNGDYVMRLKNGGKYSFLVEPYGGEVAYKGRVELPYQEDIKVLRQEIEIVKDDSGEKLIIRNLFEEEPEADDAKIIAQVLVDNANINESKPAEITISPEEIIAILENDKAAQQEIILSLESERDASYLLANKKRELAHKDLELADQLEKQIDINEASNENLSRHNEFASLVQDARIHTEEAESAYKIGKKIEQAIASTQMQVNETEGYLVRVQGAKEENDGAALNDLFTNYNIDKIEISESLVSDQLSSAIQSESDLMKLAVKKAERIAEEQEAIKGEISTAKAQVRATKKKKEKEQNQLTIDALEAELMPLEEERNTALASAVVHERKVAQLQREQNLVSVVKSGSIEDLVQVTDEQKVAMMASIEATSSEISALEAVAMEMQEVLESKSEVANSLDDLIDSDTVLNSEVVGIENTEGISLDSLTGTTEELVADNRDNIQNSSETGSNQLEGNGLHEGSESTGVSQEKLDTPNISKEGTADSESSSELASGLALGVASTEVARNSDNGLENAEENSSEYFAYTAEYEELVDEVVLVEGESIPLEITSNTGKRKYTSEELKNAPVVLTKSAYNETFDQQYQDVKQKQDALAKSKATQKLNYNWVVAIEKEIAELSYAKSESDNNAYNSRIDGKVRELQDQASQKRNFMALNARIIKQLQEQEQLAENSVNQDGDIEPRETPAINKGLVSAEELNSELSKGNKEVIENEVNSFENQGQALTPQENSEVIVVPVDPSATTVVENATILETGEAEGLEGQEENGATNPVAQKEMMSQLEETESNEPPLNNEETELTVPDPPLQENEEEEITPININGTQTNNVLNDGPEMAESIIENENIEPSANNNSSTNQEIESIEMAELTPIQEAQISPSAVVVTQIEIEKENQQNVVQTSQSELVELESILEETKKKKKRRVLEAEVAHKRAEVTYENQKLDLVDVKKVQVEQAQTEMVKDPLGERPSSFKFSEARKHEIKKGELQTELEVLEFQLSETKKKKKRRVIDADILEVKRKIASKNLEAQMAKETAIEMQKVETETLKSLTPYGEEVLVKIPEIENQMSLEQLKEVEQLEAYVSYTQTKEKSEKEIQAANVMYESAKTKQLEAVKIEEEISLLKEGLSLLPEEEQAPIQANINEKRVTQNRIISEAEVMYQEAKSLENEAYYNLNEANSELLVLDNARERTLIFTAVNSNVKTKVEDIVFDSTNIDAIPTSLTSDIFVDSDSTFYNDAKPIPVDVELPKGVILKVQIGAFRNPINQATFKGFAPIVGEVTPSGLTRYTAGLFKDFETANGAKDGIRAKGYSDAFVVAYLDGKRISISEARRVLAGEINETEVAIQTEAPINNTSQNEASVPVTEINSVPLLPGQGDVQVAETSTRDELFFTVQVGVYSQTIQPGSVLALTPLNSENIPNNLVRYSSGVYGSIAKASVARNRIILSSGISDAFVTAYYKGARIPLSEARALMAGVQVPNNTTTPAQEPTSNTNEENNATGINNTQGQTGSYYVTIGPYTAGIPIEQAREILAINALGVVVEKNNGATLYKIGNFTNREEAKALKLDLEFKGLNNPTVKQNEK